MTDRASASINGVTLRDLVAGDADACFEWMRDRESVAMAAFTAPDPDDRNEFDTWFARILANPTVIAQAVCNGGELVGMIATFTMDAERELTYWIDRAVWGQGIASAALALMLERDLHRPLQARTAVHNVRSAAVVTRHGFLEVGRDIDFAAGVQRDTEEIIFELR
ncbi:putative acetyltransferase [marine actinobacterium PHSC20C1]|nr:putative acetyltransferase [marine actinobacterium PHSC20C1]